MSGYIFLQRLSELYYDIHRSYLKVNEVVNSEKRLFGRYYRVAFYGQVSHVKMDVRRIKMCSAVHDSNPLEAM